MENQGKNTKTAVYKQKRKKLCTSCQHFVDNLCKRCFLPVNMCGNKKKHRKYLTFQVLTLIIGVMFLSIKGFLCQFIKILNKNRLNISYKIISNEIKGGALNYENDIPT